MELLEKMKINLDTYFQKNGNLGFLDAIRKDYDFSDINEKIELVTHRKGNISTAIFRYLLEERSKNAYTIDQFVETTTIETDNPFIKENFDRAIEIMITRRKSHEKNLVRCDNNE